MEEFHAENYGDRWANVYDLWFSCLDVSPCVEALAGLAGGSGKSVLELGIGTGRFALPLSLKGCCVSGIDISAKMIENLRSRNGAGKLSLICGNFADVEAKGPFDLIY